MANIRPVFISAPQIRLSINNSLIAYAIGINLNVNVDVQSVYAFGDYGPVNVEPLMYGIVTGTLQILQLTANALNDPGNADGTQSILQQRVTLADSLKETSGIFNENGKTVPLPGNASNSPIILEDLNRHLDPQKVLYSKTFDMDIKLKHKTDDFPAKEIDSSLLRVENCRLSGRNVNITLGALVNMPLSFQGLLLLDSEKDVSAQEKSDSGRTDGA